MKEPLHVILVAGARPNFMKIAPLVHAFDAHNEDGAGGGRMVNWILVHTGQHYDQKMSEVFFRELEIPEPQINLEVGSGSHAVQTANVMTRFETVCEEHRPDWVVVVGDVNSTLACTLVASKLGIRVAHVEAGLRSFDRDMPEEINRLVTDTLADMLFTPSEDGDQNLRREGVSEEKIMQVGNIMIDALVRHLPQARRSRVIQAHGVDENAFAYVTLHRPSNVDTVDSLRPIVDGLRGLAERMPILFPMHPRTRKMLERFDLRLDHDPRIHVLEPIGYTDSICLSEKARLVVTDSGGLQEETTYFGTPCLTLRPNTERPVTVTCGSNRLTRPETLIDDIDAVLAGGLRLGRVPQLWDGKTAPRIVRCLVEADAGAATPEPAEARGV